MADKKISQLTALTGANTASDDVFAIVDTSVTETKKISLTELQSAPISAGTANGVAYLNGSKVLTTGSALTFNGSNLGLGVTPSAWAGNLVKAFQIADNGASFSSYSTGNTSVPHAILSNNAYYDAGGWKYAKSTGSAQYQVANQEHRWYTAPSGTAGNAISFTQAMTLDASGNLGVGNTSPSSYDSLARNLVIGGSSYYSGMTIANTTNGAGTIFFADGTASGNQVAGQIQYDHSVNSLAFGTNATERMRIDTSGNLISTAPTTPPTLSTNGTMVFNLTSNTNLRVSVRGSDGVTRTANITLA